MIKKSFLCLFFLTLFFSIFAEQSLLFIIDPSHGGKDTGAIGTYISNGNKTTIFEKDIVLAISKKVYDLAKQQCPDMAILLTRETDVFLTFEERASKVKFDNKSTSVLFISIANNTSRDTSKSGFKIFTLPTNGNKNTSIAKSLSKNLDKLIGKKIKNLGITEWKEASKNTANIIIELGFLSNSNDVALLANEEFLTMCAQGILNGIKSLIEK